MPLSLVIADSPSYHSGYILGVLLSDIMSFHKVSFLLHAAIETPAAINFLLFPNDQLSSPSPQAHPVIRQYAMLLLSTVIISFIIAFKPLDIVSGKIAGALAIYHCGPLIRATCKLASRKRLRERSLLGQPWLHLILHSICLVSLGSSCWSLYLSHYDTLPLP